MQVPTPEFGHTRNFRLANVMTLNKLLPSIRRLEGFRNGCSARRYFGVVEIDIVVSLGPQKRLDIESIRVVGRVAREEGNNV